MKGCVFINGVFTCFKCDYTTSKKSSWMKHLSTRKHLLNKIEQKLNNVQTVARETILCSKCNRGYANRNGLWYHQKKPCATFEPINTIIDVVQNTNDFQQFLMEQNNEYKTHIMEQNRLMVEQLAEKDKAIFELSNKTTIQQTNSNNTSNINSNNKFNLNVFLNETCKDAMNITDFMSTLQYKLSDLENTCDLGYAEGISRIMIRGLKDMDICKRPIHCSDLKRETIYLKVTNGWEKENESKEKLRKMIGTIANNNIGQTPKWVEMHPDCKNWNSKNNSRYIQLVNASMGGADKEEDEKFMNKIIHNVAKEVVIEKQPEQVVTK